MARNAPSLSALRVAELSNTGSNGFSLKPDAAERRQFAEELQLTTLRKLSFEGEVLGLGTSDWELRGTLGATVVQPCVVTLEPVTTRIDVDVTRRYLKDYTDPDEPEAEMPEDETTEELGQWIDPGQVMIEALAIAVPDYPRLPEAELGQMVYTEPGKQAMTDEEAKPFAGLGALKEQLSKKN